MTETPCDLRLGVTITVARRSHLATPDLAARKESIREQVSLAFSNKDHGWQLGTYHRFGVFLNRAAQSGALAPVNLLPTAR